MKQTLFIDDEVIANLNPPFNNFNSKQIIQILERIVETNYSKLEFAEIELIRTLEKFHPNIIDEVSAKLAHEEELEELNFYNESFELEDDSPFASWTDEQEKELMEFNYQNTEKEEDILNEYDYWSDYEDGFDDTSVFFYPDSTCVQLDVFTLDLNDEEILEHSLLSFDTFPDISPILISKFGGNDYIDKHKIITESGTFTGINEDCVDAFIIDINKVLEKFDSFNDSDFINSYADLFDINPDEFPYFSEQDIVDLGESLTMLLDALDTFKKDCKLNINKNLLFSITVG